MYDLGKGVSNSWGKELIIGKKIGTWEKIGTSMILCFTLIKKDDL
jgi:hypothetical protein